MTAIDGEAEYNNRIRVAAYPDIVARWRATSAVERGAARGEFDLPYGDGERQRHALYRAGGPGAPLVVFIHGGYWQLGSRQDTAFVARAFTAAGIDLAVPSYSLCPAVSVMGIVDDIRRFLVALW